MTYFTYDLHEFGNIRRAYLHYTEPETVNVTRNFLRPAGTDAAVSGMNWAEVQFRSDTRTNYLFDGNTSTAGSISVASGQEKPIEFNFSGVPSVTSVGDAKLTTTQSKFSAGGESAASSGRIGASAYLKARHAFLSIPKDDAFDFGTGDFTIDAWVKLETLDDGGRTIASTHSVGSIGWIFKINDPSSNTHPTHLDFYDSGTSYSVPTSAFAVDTWYHLAVARQGSKIFFFRDGVLAGGRDISSSERGEAGGGTVQNRPHKRFKTPQQQIQ